MFYLGTFIFFISFFRISFIHPYFYLVFFPAVIGFFYFFGRKDFWRIERDSVFLIFFFIILSLYSLVLDVFQTGLSLESSFLFRLFTIVFFSFFPAYFLNLFIIKCRDDYFDKIVKYAFIVQIFFFFLMYLNPQSKPLFYSLIGLGGSVNLNSQNLLTRGFGLSGEINFMTPFMMVYLTFLIYRRNIFLKIIIFFTQIINSNMALLAAVVGFLITKTNLSLKIFFVGLMVVFYYFIGEKIIKEKMPRVYDEYIVGGGTRTVDGLLSNHIFSLGELNPITILFGFQKNISSSVDDSNIYSDMGWVIMFNYGGVFLIFLVLMVIFLLSMRIFSNKFYALIWFFVGMILNTKGMIIGMNGYFFLSFLLLLSQRYNKLSRK